MSGMSEPRWRQTIDQVLRGRHLSRADAAAVMDAMMSGALGDIRSAAFLAAMAAKGPVVEELVGLATVMRDRAIPVAVHRGPVLDTCGTGGSGLETPNVSTMAAFVVAAAGVRVAKHGNRASSGRCGSSDLLEALGVPVSIGPELAERLLDEVGLAFLFAPRYHPAVKAVMPVRRRVGFRTVFNFLGPLCNPAGAELQLLGVSDPAYAPLMADALAALGSSRVLVVHGADGLDEVTLTGPTHTWLVEGGQVTEGVFRPTDAGIKVAPFEAFRGGGVVENAAIFDQVMAGEPGPYLDLVALNAGAALWVAGRVSSLTAGAAQAEALLQSGAAFALFERYKEATLAAQ
jgi:anthranilate phosphoribosyltransferase